jgi:transketolase
VPYLGDRQAPVERGAYVLSGNDGQPDMILIATGSEVSLAAEAALILEAQGIKTRVVSMPSMELFAAQDEPYRDSVLPPSVRARVSIEAGSTFGWDRWIGDRGLAIGIDHFGASAPAADIARAFGFTAQDVAAKAARLLTTA